MSLHKLTNDYMDKNPVEYLIDERLNQLKIAVKLGHISSGSVLQRHVKNLIQWVHFELTGSFEKTTDETFLLINESQKRTTTTKLFKLGA